MKNDHFPLHEEYRGCFVIYFQTELFATVKVASHCQCALMQYLTIDLRESDTRIPGEKV